MLNTCIVLAKFLHYMSITLLPVYITHGSHPIPLGKCILRTDIELQ